MTPPILAAAPLLAWTVSDSEYPEHGSVLVYAANREQARSLGVQAEICEDYADASARRCPDADSHAGAEPRIEGRARVLRSLGWREEDEPQCTACGLYANGLAEFVVTDDVCAACKETT